MATAINSHNYPFLGGNRLLFQERVKSPKLLAKINFQYHRGCLQINNKQTGDASIRKLIGLFKRKAELPFIHTPYFRILFLVFNPFTISQIFKKRFIFILFFFLIGASMKQLLLLSTEYTPFCILTSLNSSRSLEGL